jgi:hypothetical protein
MVDLKRGFQGFNGERFLRSQFGNMFVFFKDLVERGSQGCHGERFFKSQYQNVERCVCACVCVRESTFHLCVSMSILKHIDKVNNYLFSKIEFHF